MQKLPEGTEHVGAVGALMTIEIDGKKHVILQRRTADDSFPGCLQVTAHGGLEGKNRAERESMMNGLKREIKEELWEILERSSLRGFGKSIFDGIDNAMTMNLAVDPNYFSEEQKRRRVFLSNKGILKVSRKIHKNTRKTDVTLGFAITQENQQHYPKLLPEIQQLAEDGVIILLCSDDLGNLVPLDPKLHKQNGVQEKGKYGMFQDEIDAVKKALK